MKNLIRASYAIIRLSGLFFTSERRNLSSVYLEIKEILNSTTFNISTFTGPIYNTNRRFSRLKP
jgi:hypothetical protein